MERFVRKAAALVCAAALLSVCSCTENETESKSSSKKNKKADSSVSSLDVRDDSSLIVKPVSSSQSGDDESSEPETPTEVSPLKDIELSNKTVKYLSHYSIEPTDGDLVDPGFVLFKDKYGGDLEWMQTSWNERFDDLEKHIASGDAPDMFQYSDMDVFPLIAIKDCIQPVDGVIDRSSEIWEDKNFIGWKGKDYLPVIIDEPNYVCIYSRNEIENNGFEDPAELFYNDEWTWSTFKDMCEEFSDGDKCALDGYSSWINSSIASSSGVPLIGMEDGRPVNNIDNLDYGNAQKLYDELVKSKAANTSWEPLYGSDISFNDKQLFITVGLWAIESNSGNMMDQVRDGEVMFVPMPKQDGTDTYYCQSRAYGYFLCKDAPNPEGYAALMDCLAYSADETFEYEQAQCENWGWNDEMLEMRKAVFELAAEHPVYDFSEGVSPDVGSIVSNGAYRSSWDEYKAENKAKLDHLIDEANK